MMYQWYHTGGGGVTLYKQNVALSHLGKVT